jgi:hypothetical protein
MHEVGRMMTRRIAGLLLVLFLAGHAEAASPPEDRILGLDRYTSEKGRTLATTYSGALRQLNATVYHCMPWLEVPREGIGFYKPKDASRDDRYLSIRVYIEQEASTQFAAMPVEQRASSMFSRYVGPMLRRMAANRAMLGDASLDGFTVILGWLKSTPISGGRPVHETIAVFLDKQTAAAYLQGQLKATDLPGRARVYGWDGETALGKLSIAAWDDNFVATYKVQNYQLAPGVTCP